MGICVEKGSLYEGDKLGLSLFPIKINSFENGFNLYFKSKIFILKRIKFQYLFKNGSASTAILPNQESRCLSP